MDSDRATIRRREPRHGARAEAPIRELDRVRLTGPVTADDDRAVPAGATGTVVAVYAEGAAFEVEFTVPVDALATVERQLVALVERAPD